MPGVDGDDAGSRLQRGLREVRRLAVVRRDAKVLEFQRRRGEARGVGDGLAERESRHFSRVRPERVAQQPDVLLAVSPDDVGEVPQLAVKSAVRERLAVERRLQLLEEQRVIQNLDVSRLARAGERGSRNPRRKDGPDREPAGANRQAQKTPSRG